MKIKNRRKFLKNLKRIPHEVRKSVKKDLNTGADEMIRAARLFVPKDKLVLASTIRREKGRHPLQIQVKAGGAATTQQIVPTYNPSNKKKFFQALGYQKKIPDFDYALAQEFGTTKMPAHPFFWPAYRLTKKRIKSRIMRNANKIIKRIAGS